MLVFITVGTDPDATRRLRGEWAESLAEHMKTNGLSRKAVRHRLAEFGVDVSEQAIGYWLRGDTAPRPEHQAALAAVFRVPVRRLFPIEAALPEAVA